MATPTHHSGAQGKPPGNPPVETARKPGEIWLNGDVLACACPECAAPMSIRLWLMVADCWRCGTSIELTEEQERQARKLLARRPAAPAPEPAKQAAPVKKVAPAQPQRPAQSPAKPTKAPSPVAAKPVEATPAVPAPRALQPALPQPQPAPAKSPASPAPGRLPPAQTRPAAAPPPVPRRAPIRQGGRWLRDLLKYAPAWLISAILHLLVMILLGLWAIDDDEGEPELVLAFSFSLQAEPGVQPQDEESPDTLEVKVAGEEESSEPDDDPAEVEMRKIAGELSLVDASEQGTLPEMSAVVEAISSPRAERMFQGRDPRIRAQVIMQEGGSWETEQAVVQGLRWIAAHQNDDGSWSLDRFHEAGDCNGQCHGEGSGRSDMGATALALLPMLGAGQTHYQGIYKPEVAAGLRWLVSHQRRNGDLSGSGVGRMYAHGQATIVLCEAYALTGDQRLREPAQKAVDYILDAQHREGGWRYTPGQPGDTSVVGWQLMALRSAKMAGLDVPNHAFERAGHFLDRVQTGVYGGFYAYMLGHPVTPAMTAEGLLCRQYLGWSEDDPGLREGVSFLIEEHLPRGDRPNIYYWYYGTQVLHHMGGEPWQRWNSAMRDALLSTRETEGHEAGSWDPRGGINGGHDTHTGGRLYVTSLAICTLEVYYRHLPLYRGIELDDLAAARK